MSGLEQFSRVRGSRVAGVGAGAPDVVVIAFSAGGLHPLQCILRSLPTEFQAAVVVAHHVARPTELPAIIRTATRLPAQLLSEGDALTNGVVYVAPPNRHVFFRLNRTLGLSSAPRLRFVRPSADWLFESAAAAFGRCCTAVVLSGRLSDGACGVVRVKRADGCVIAQTPSTCDYPSMPAAAIRARCVDLVLEPEAIGPALCRIVGESHSTPLANEWQAPFAALDC